MKGFQKPGALAELGEAKGDGPGPKGEHVVPITRKPVFSDRLL